VGKEPEGIAQSPDGQWLVVTSEEDDAVSWIDLATHQVVSTMDTEKRPRHVEFTADGKELWIAAEVGGVVQIADPKTRAITATIPSRSRACRITRSCPAASASLPMARPPWSPWAGRTASP
jgi:YVTN family beta-propeller protein